MKTLKRAAVVPSAVLVAAGLAASPAAAKSGHHVHSYASHAGVYFAHRTHQGTRYGALVSDGPGTGFGFHRLPYPYRAAAAAESDEQSEAVRSAVADSAVESTGWGYFPGDSVYGYGNAAAYGVFNGADGYGSPYFAGYYGPGDGEDYGPFGHGYTD